MMHKKVINTTKDGRKDNKITVHCIRFPDNLVILSDGGKDMTDVLRSYLIN